MAEEIRPELLEFLQPEGTGLRILVVESLSYLARLRQMFPQAELYAVAEEQDRMEQDVYQGLAVDFACLDYTAERLPYPQEYFDYIISDLLLERVSNPQDIAAGFATFLKQTGALLTSFRNIRHWSVLQSLMEGHYYGIVSRLYAKTEFERLLYASSYKDVHVRPQRREASDDITARLVKAGFDNAHDDIDTEFWLVRADRSVPEIAMLKSLYTPEQRRELARLLHRIEYDVDTAAQCEAFWALYDRLDLFPEYVANFVQEAVFHPQQFYQHLRTGAAGHQDEILAMQSCQQQSAD